jgi:hypothetical protein
MEGTAGGGPWQSAGHGMHWDKQIRHRHQSMDCRYMNGFLVAHVSDVQQPEPPSGGIIQRGVLLGRVLDYY